MKIAILSHNLSYHKFLTDPKLPWPWQFLFKIRQSWLLTWSFIVCLHLRKRIY